MDVFISRRVCLCVDEFIVGVVCAPTGCVHPPVVGANEKCVIFVCLAEALCMQQCHSALILGGTWRIGNSAFEACMKFNIYSVLEKTSEEGH
jgi:hypothetical protein